VVKSDQQEDFITIPILSTANVPILGKGAIGTKYDWNLTTVPQVGLSNRSYPTPAGKVIGGGTVLNGMVWNRASKEDYNRWEELGNPGWNFDALQPYFKKAETFTPPSPEIAEYDIKYIPAYHGEHGDAQSSFPVFVWPVSSE
jgi:choline dehydrogenase-like flavoprotein